MHENEHSFRFRCKDRTYSSIGCEGRIVWQKAGRSCQDLRRFPQHPRQMDESLPRRWNTRLQAKPRGRPKGAPCCRGEAAQIAKAMVDHHPEQLKLPFYLWTRVGGLALDPTPVRDQAVGVDGGSLFGPLGFYPTKAHAPSPGEEPRRGATLGWRRNTRKFAHEPKKRRPRFFGATKWERDPDHARRAILWASWSNPHNRQYRQTASAAIWSSAVTNQGRLNFMVFKERFDTKVFLGISPPFGAPEFP